MPRSIPLSARLPLAAFFVILFAFGACGSEGYYELSWKFQDVANPASAPTEFNARDCGAHGVDALEIHLRRSDGTDAQTRALACAYGTARHGIDPGSYTLTVFYRTRSGGTLVDSALTPWVGNMGQTEDVIEVTEDHTTPREVILWPVPQCDDTVDNNANGLVDGADPGCVCADTADLTCALFE